MFVSGVGFTAGGAGLGMETTGCGEGTGWGEISGVTTLIGAGVSTGFSSMGFGDAGWTVGFSGAAIRVKVMTEFSC